MYLQSQSPTVVRCPLSLAYRNCSGSSEFINNEKHKRDKSQIFIYSDTIICIIYIVQSHRSNHRVKHVCEIRNN